MKLCGVLNIDKPTGVTSRAVVDRVLKLVRPAKCGHAGTLDPLATGVLVVCVGHATRLMTVIQEGRKLYRGRFRLGQRSDTDDITGQLSESGDWTPVTRAQIEELLLSHTGQIQQVPPQFSAIHVEGQRAYDLARRGHTMELEARPVDIFALRLTDFRPPEFELEIECGSGTYVRSIGRDLGLQLGCGAVMTQLRRLKIGSFRVEESLTWDQLIADNLARSLQPAVSAVAHFPQRILTPSEITAVRCGQSLGRSVTPSKAAVDPACSNDSLGQEQRTALLSPEGELLGIGLTDFGTGRLQPKVIFPA